MPVSDQMQDYRCVLYAGDGNGDGARGTIQLTGTTLVMSLRFVEAPTSGRPLVVAPISLGTLTTFIAVDMPSVHWERTVDLLRNEKPLWFGEDNGRVWIATTNEPVGEGGG